MFKDRADRLNLLRVGT